MQIAKKTLKQLIKDNQGTIDHINDEIKKGNYTHPMYRDMILKNQGKIEAYQILLKF